MGPDVIWLPVLSHKKLVVSAGANSNLIFSKETSNITDTISRVAFFPIVFLTMGFLNLLALEESLYNSS